jgi:hypothetical protein
MRDPDGSDTAGEPLTFEAFRRSFYYGAHADMQFKFLASLSDEEAADAVARLLASLGTAFDTGDLDAVGALAQELQAGAYTPADEPEPEEDDAPFARLQGALSDVPLVLISAGGVFVRGDDPMGADGPTQEEALDLIQDFLRGSPTLSTVPVDTPVAQLSARHPGYDARSAQRDPDTVFPLSHLRALQDEGRVQLTAEHHTFVGATSQRRLRKEVAPRWADELADRGVGAALLVAT